MALRQQLNTPIVLLRYRHQRQSRPSLHKTTEMMWLKYRCLQSEPRPTIPIHCPPKRALRNLKQKDRSGTEPKLKDTSLIVHDGRCREVLNDKSSRLAITGNILRLAVDYRKLSKFAKIIQLARLLQKMRTSRAWLFCIFKKGGKSQAGFGPCLGDPILLTSWNYFHKSWSPARLLPTKSRLWMCLFLWV